MILHESWVQLFNKSCTYDLNPSATNTANNTSDFVTITVDPREIDDCNVSLEKSHPIRIILKNSHVIQSEVTTDVLYQLIPSNDYATD